MYVVYAFCSYYVYIAHDKRKRKRIDKTTGDGKLRVRRQELEPLGIT